MTKSNTLRCHMYVAIKRKKDNINAKNKLCIRQIIKDYDKDRKIIISKMKILEHGHWRLYRTVNARNVEKAYREFIHYLIDNGPIINIDSKWKSILLKNHNKAESKFLIDVDKPGKSIERNMSKYLQERNIQIYEHTTTLNGLHFIVAPFDTRAFEENFEFPVEIKKDALFFENIYHIH